MFSGSTIHIYLYAPDGTGETDITTSCIFAQCRFELAMNAQPGMFEVTIKDSEQTRSFRSGQRIKLVVDGVTLFGGFVLQVGNKFAFPVDDTTEVDQVQSRQFVLRGVDYNILLDKRVLRNTADYLHQIPDLPGDTPDGVAIRTMCSKYLDLPAGFSVAKVQNVGYLWFEAGPEDAQGFPLPYPDPTRTWPWMTQGTTMRDMIATIAEPNRALYWIDGDMRLWYVAIDDSTMPWGFSDVPNNNPIANGTDAYGTGANRPASTIGFRDLDFIEDGSIIVTDGMVWGGKALTSGDIVFARVQNRADGTTEHTSRTFIQQGNPVAGSPLDVYGRWQRGEVHVGEDYYGTLGNVRIRARNIVKGPSGAVAGQERGLSQPQFTVGLTWYAHEVPQTGGAPFHVRPGYFTNIELYTFGENREASGQTVRIPLIKTLPARSVQISFPTLDSRDGSAYVEFNGTFGLSADDPWSLWKYLAERKTVPPVQPVPVTSSSTSSDYGSPATIQPLEPTDGSRTDFTLVLAGGSPVGYIAGSLSVYVDGIQQTKGTQVVELDPTAGTFRITLAPAAGSVVTAQFNALAVTAPPTSPSTTGTFLTRPTSAPVVVNGGSSALLQNLTIQGSGGRDNATGIGISIFNVHGTVTLRDLDLADLAGGIYLNNCSGSLVIDNIRGRNIGDNTIGSGHSNYIQFNNCSFSGSVSNCKFLGGHTEDMISIFQSGGLGAGQELVIENNQLQGLVADTSTVRAWTRNSGTGIIVGDGPGSSKNGHTIVRNNTLLTPGQVGLQIIDGPAIHVYNNIVYGEQRISNNNPITSYAGNPIAEVDHNTYYWTNNDGSHPTPYFGAGTINAHDNTQNAGLDPADYVIVL